jgi:hypothetical protein
MQNYKQCIDLRNQFHTIPKHKNQKLKLEKVHTSLLLYEMNIQEYLHNIKTFLKKFNYFL